MTKSRHAEDDPPRRGTVVKLQAQQFVVQSGEERFACLPRGRMKKDRSDQVRLIAVGDEVEFRPSGAGEGAIEKVLPRRTKIARPSVRHAHKEQVIVANVDLILAVQSARDPELHFENLDRCLAIAEHHGIPERVVVINKADLATEDDRNATKIAYGPAGYEVLFTSARDGAGLEALRARVAGRTSVFLGPSGAGKSSLVNALLPDAHLKVGEVSEYTGEGRHTTTWVEMLPLSGGGFVIDTPGMEVFGLQGVEKVDLGRLFPELAERLGACRFNDCLHQTEPHCAVRAAVEAGEIPRSRYDSYRKLLDEIRPREYPK